MVTIKFNLIDEYAEVIVNNRIVYKYYNDANISTLFTEELDIKDGDIIEIKKTPLKRSND